MGLLVMKSFSRGLAAAAFGLSAIGIGSSASAALINGSFEVDSLSPGGFLFGGNGYQFGGGAGTYRPGSGLYTGGVNGSNVAVINSGGILFQSVGVTINTNGSYTFSGVYGMPTGNASFGGSFGFFAGDINNVILEQTFAAPATQGVLQSFSLTFLGSNFAQFAGQTLGVFIRGATVSGRQATVDNLAFANSVVTPLPGAVWLFGSALAAGFAASRRRKSQSA